MTKGNLHGGQNFGQYTCSHILSRRRNSYKCDCIQIMGCSQGLGRSRLKVAGKNFLERGLWIELSKQAKDAKILVSHKCSPKCDLSRERLH